MAWLVKFKGFLWLIRLWIPWRGKIKLLLHVMARLLDLVLLYLRLTLTYNLRLWILLSRLLIIYTRHLRWLKLLLLDLILVGMTLKNWIISRLFLKFWLLGISKIHVRIILIKVLWIPWLLSGHVSKLILTRWYLILLSAHVVRLVVLRVVVHL